MESFLREKSVMSEKTATDIATEVLSTLDAILAIFQATVQTLFILECLRRYAAFDSPFMQKPARELITALLLTNVSLWFFEVIFLLFCRIKIWTEFVDFIYWK